MISLFVKAGDSLTWHLWNAFWAERRRQRLRAGPGVKLRETSDGVVINFDAGPQIWLHPWKVNFSGFDATFRPGVINGTVEPTIGGVPLGGNAKKKLPAPKLTVDPMLFDAELRSWLVVEVAPADGGEVKTAIVRQVAKLVQYGPQYPLVVLKRDATSGQIERIQHAMFNLKHWSAVSADGATVRHFFSGQP